MSCSSLDILKSLKSDIEARNRKKYDEDLLLHVDACIDSWKTSKDRLKMFRTVDGLAATAGTALTWDSMSETGEFKSMVNLNCHNGQKKLTYSVLEFINTALSSMKNVVDRKRVTVVYAGASGLATVIAAKVFKDIEFVMYDPAPNTLSLIPEKYVSDVQTVTQLPKPGFARKKRVLLYTGKAGYFDDERAVEIGREVRDRDRKLLFISDIRMEAKENSIANDMQSQQRWAILTRSFAYMFKFRLPYNELNKEKNEKVVPPSVKAKYLDVRHMHDAAARVDRVKLHALGGSTPVVADPNFGFQYLSGKLYIQLYPRVSTAELRLIGFSSATKAASIEERAYTMAWYDRGEIESKMALFNFLYRSHACFEGALPERTGMQHTYEAVAEMAIVERCLALTLENKTVTVPEKRALVKEIFDIINMSIESKMTTAACVKLNSGKLKHALTTMPKSSNLKQDLAKCSE